MIQSKTILAALPYALDTVDLSFLGEKKQGKVRDIYIQDDKRILITTDRQSAFDVILGLIPFKGQVLNRLSQFWFEQTSDIVKNHMISVPDANVMVTRNAKSIPIEMIVRGYLSGVTKTSPWYSYQKGERTIYGIKFPDEMHKNQKLWEPIITPTTHPEAGASVHDERLTEDEIIGQGIVEKNLYEQMKKISLALFELGTNIAAKAGLILVDTKYEFGLVNGELTLIDEIHTPDSSRFWIEKTYQHRVNMEMEPENYDKEFLRLWYVEKGYRGDGTPPPMDNELIVKTAQRYIGVYEKITGKTFESGNYEGIKERIKRNLKEKLPSLI